MYRDRFVILLLLLFKIAGVYSQENVYLRQPLRDDTIYCPKDTIKLYLDDTSYYSQKNIQQLIDDIGNATSYFKYFSSTDGLEFGLKDSLPDGFYCLYNITKKQAIKIKNHEKYFVVSGEFKNGMKQGAFIFYNFSKWSESFKIAYFKDDAVHGQVKEILNGKIIYLVEYNMGLKDGLFYNAINSTNPIIILYMDGKVVREVYF
jgi:hypothetical protein